MADVICIGFSCIDVMMNGILVDAVHRKAEIDFDKYFVHFVETDLAPGGDAGNQAVNMAKMGVNVQLLVGVGNDVPGQILILLAEKQGVDMSKVTVHPTAKTGVYTNLIQPVGERFYLSEHTSPSRTFTPDLTLLKGSKIVTLGSLFIEPLTDRDIALGIVKAAKKEGAIVCADVKQPAAVSPLAYYQDVWPYIDYLFPNEIEGQQLTGESDHDRILDRLLSCGVKNVILKVGAKGCIFANSSQRIRIPALEATIVDTTGAGDAFLAGFCTAYLDGKNDLECCRFGSAAAAAAIESLGATAGIKDKHQIIQSLAQRKPISLGGG